MLLPLLPVLPVLCVLCVLLLLIPRGLLTASAAGIINGCLNGLMTTGSCRTAGACGVLSVEPKSSLVMLTDCDEEDDAGSMPACMQMIKT